MARFCLIFWVCLLLLIIEKNQAKALSWKNLMHGDLFEGDIALPKSSGVRSFISSALSRKMSAEASYELWTNGQVPYVIQSNTYTQSDIDVIMLAMRTIEEQTRWNGIGFVKFIPRTNEKNYLRIHSGSGCWSYVGKYKELGAQDLSLAKPGCITKGTIMHELLHALGFWHEQSRPDRDNHVKINHENINPTQLFNFEKHNDVHTLGQSYDYNSIMHYGHLAFTRNGKPTIEPIKKGVKLLGADEKTMLSDVDAQEVRILYGLGKNESKIKEILPKDIGTLDQILLRNSRRLRNVIIKYEKRLQDLKNLLPKGIEKIQELNENTLEMLKELKEKNMKKLENIFDIRKWG